MYKQIDYTVCKRLLLNLLPTDRHAFYLGMFDALEKHPVDALFASLSTASGQMVSDPASVRSDSLMRGMFMGLSLALASDHDQTRELLKYQEDMVKKVRGENVASLADAAAVRK